MVAMMNNMCTLKVFFISYSLSFTLFYQMQTPALSTHSTVVLTLSLQPKVNSRSLPSLLRGDSQNYFFLMFCISTLISP